MTLKKTKKNQVKLPRSVKRLFPQVTEAFDADKAVEVSVNKKDCRDSQRLNPSECALAHAAKRELRSDGVIIGMTSSYVIKGKTAIRFATPASVQREIVSFDRHQDFAPGDYYLTPKSPSSRLGAYQSRPGGSGGKNKSIRRKIHRSARVRILPRGVE
jgi:hypothetical protein